MRRLYNWIMRQAAGPYATPVLAFLSFLESSFFPIPPDVMLVPMCLANRRRALFYALVCTASSVLGGLLGYAIGYYLIETVGRGIIQFYGLEHAFEDYQAMFKEWGLWIILIKGATPIPYKIVTIASGAASFDLTVFVLASIVTRGVRFGAEALLLRLYGEPIRQFIEKRLNQLTWIFLACLVGGFVAVRFIF
jgi:membrane protein YqaA with SNARE-associated domain